MSGKEYYAYTPKVSYDIKATNSIISPYIAVVDYFLIHKNTVDKSKIDPAILPLLGQILADASVSIHATYAYQDIMRSESRAFATAGLEREYDWVMTADVRVEKT